MTEPVRTQCAGAALLFRMLDAREERDVSMIREVYEEARQQGTPIVTLMACFLFRVGDLVQIGHLKTTSGEPLNDSIGSIVKELEDTNTKIARWGCED